MSTVHLAVSGAAMTLAAVAACGPAAPLPGAPPSASAHLVPTVNIAPPDAGALVPVPVGPSPFVVAAEGPIALRASALDDGILLTSAADPRSEATPPWILVQSGSVREVPPIPASVEPSGVGTPGIASTLGGSYGKTLSLIHVWNSEAHEWASPASDVFLRRNDRWERVHASKDRACYAVWEAHPGCFLGLEGDWFIDPGKSTTRVLIDCKDHPPKPVDAPFPEEKAAKAPYRRLKLKGLSDGGIAAILARGDDRMLLDHSAAGGGAPPLLGLWTGAGERRSMALPLTKEMESVDLITISPLDILESPGALVVTGSVWTGNGKGDQAGAREIPYVARCKDVCTLVDLPTARPLDRVALLDDGTLILAGSEEALPLVVWAEIANEHRFEKLGAVPAAPGSALVGMFAKSRDDVWLARTTKAKGALAAHTWVLHNQPVAAPLLFKPAPPGG